MRPFTFSGYWVLSVGHWPSAPRSSAMPLPAASADWPWLRCCRQRISTPTPGPRCVISRACRDGGPVCGSAFMPMELLASGNCWAASLRPFGLPKGPVSNSASRDADRRPSRRHGCRGTGRWLSTWRSVGAHGLADGRVGASAADPGHQPGPATKPVSAVTGTGPGRGHLSGTGTTARARHPRCPATSSRHWSHRRRQIHIAAQSHRPIHGRGRWLRRHRTQG